MLETLPLIRSLRRARARAAAPLFTRVRQVCTVVDDFEATIENLVEHLGIGPFRCWHFRAPVLYNTTFRGRPAVWTMKLGITWLDDLQWEVIQPMDGASLYREHLDARGRGVQHLIMDTGAASFESAVAELAARGHHFAQTAMVNPPVKIGRVTLPRFPRPLAPPVSLQFGYLDLERELGTAIELTRYPLGFSERFALRAGRAERCIPDGNSHYERPLPHLRVRRACKVSIVTADLDAAMRGWIAVAGVAPWHVFEGERARVAWALVDDMLLELVQPGPEASPYHELLRARGQSVATVGVETRGDLDDVVARCAALGAGVTARGPLVGTHRAAVIASRRLFGTDLELVEPADGIASLFQRQRPDRIVGPN
jgi:hypothetical protein